MKTAAGALILLAAMLSGGQAYGADLADMRRLLTKAPLICGGFIQQKFLKALTRPLVSRGTVRFSAGKGVLWQVTEPFPARALVTGDALIRWDENGKPSRSGFGQSAHFRALSDVFLAVFGNTTVRLAESFVVEVTVADAGWQLTLVPRDPAIAKWIVRIGVSGASFIKDLDLLESGGDRTLITFENLTGTGCALTDAEKRHFEG